ncbi:MAG: DUF4363 family protein [Clostridiales bacterium]|jgi:hypothetical protein|nr:DUF4363 family protein [Clostridiales bacterium]
MTKELVAAAILILIPIAAFINIGYIERTTDYLMEQIDSASEQMLSGDTDSASETLENAYAEWQSHDRYAHIMLRHDEVVAVSEAFSDLRSELQGGDASPVLFEALRERLRGLLEMELPSFESVL